MNNTNLGGRGHLASDFRVRLFLAILTVTVSGFWFYSQPAQASAPETGSLTPAGGTVAWVGTKIVGAAAMGEPTCTADGEADGGDASTNCDVYALVIPADAWNGKRIKITFDASVVGQQAYDYDTVVRRESNGRPGMQGDFLNRTPDPQGQNTLDDVVATSGNAAGTVE